MPNSAENSFGADRANRVESGEQLSLDQLTGMLNTGKARINSKR
jgi:hypothetical protein